MCRDENLSDVYISKYDEIKSAYCTIFTLFASIDRQTMQLVQQQRCTQWRLHSHRQGMECSSSSDNDDDNSRSDDDDDSNRFQSHTPIQRRQKQRRRHTEAKQISALKAAKRNESNGWRRARAHTRLSVCWTCMQLRDDVILATIAIYYCSVLVHSARTMLCLFGGTVFMVNDFIGCRRRRRRRRQAYDRCAVQCWKGMICSSTNKGKKTHRIYYAWNGIGTLNDVLCQLSPSAYL